MGKHPKRRKDKYNPYNIYEDTGRYFITFRDGENNLHSFEISKELYEAFNEFELEDISYLNVWDRHLEHSDVWNETLDEVASKKEESVEDEVLRKIQTERLHEVIEELPETQKRRVKLYYYHGLTYKQIAIMEKCSDPAVMKSIKAALEKIRKGLNEEG